LRTLGHLRVQVLDDAGKPLPGAGVRVEVSTDEDFRSKRTYNCNSQGLTTVDLPKMLQAVQIYASKPGFCTARSGFWPKNRTDHSVIPDHSELRLVRPIIIGGIVRDEQGRGIEGAYSLSIGPASSVLWQSQTREGAGISPRARTSERSSIA
jgi:protocatechuate 3,4-dioxygenase beta subunit